MVLAGATLRGARGSCACTTLVGSHRQPREVYKYWVGNAEVDFPVTMHYKFQQSSPIYSGWCLRFRSSTECWLLKLLHRDRAHSANCSGDLEFHGAVLGRCRHARWCANNRAMVLTVQKTIVILHLQFIEKVVDILVCRSCSASVLSWRRQSSSHNCSRRALDQVVDVPVVVQRQGFFTVEVPQIQFIACSCGHSSCATQTGTTFPAFLLMAAMMGFLMHFASFFVLLRLCRS